MKGQWRQFIVRTDEETILQNASAGEIAEVLGCKKANVYGYANLGTKIFGKYIVEKAKSRMEEDEEEPEEWERKFYKRFRMTAKQYEEKMRELRESLAEKKEHK